MARGSRKDNVGEVRVKLLVPDLSEGAFESIVRVPAMRAMELINAKQARRAQVSDFSFGQTA